MTRHIDTFRNAYTLERTCSTKRGVYRLTLSSLKRIITLSTDARASGYRNEKWHYILHNDYTI